MSKTWIKLPYKFTPRSYQKHLLHAFFIEKKRHACCVWHRRAGKTKVCVNILMAATQMRVGSYFYLFPEYAQAKRSVWEARGEDGVPFIAHIPKNLIKGNPNNSEMKIELTNGSIIRLLGSDRYNSLRGTNPLGIIYDEYAYQNPIARDILIPITAENKGWEMYLFTPRGGNHGYKLYQSVKDNPKWYCEILTVDDTEKFSEIPVVTQETIEDFRIDGWSEDKIQQEYYCSFEAAVHGAYFSKQLKAVEEQNRIYEIPIDTSIPVNTAWDLGRQDATAIWFFQRTREGIKIINYYENRMEDIPHYVNILDDFKRKFGIVYDKHYAPHDGAHKRLGMTKSIIEQFRELGFNFVPLARYNNKNALIELGKGQFSKMHFHKSNCKQGLDCLREYHAKFNEAMGVFSLTPAHNWASHGADAYLYLAQAVKEHTNRQGNYQTMRNRVNTTPIF